VKIGLPPAMFANWVRRLLLAQAVAPHAKKPPNIVYGVDEYPPIGVALTSGIQQVGVIAVNLVYPILVFRAANTSMDTSMDLLGVAMLVLAFGTFVQVLRVGWIGSGFMCPATFTATYLAPSLMAARMGALPLVFGMTVFAGFVELLVAPLLNRLRGVFPPEISGLVIFMIGWSAGIGGLRILLAPDAPPVGWDEWTVAALTLATMSVLNIWASGLIRMLCALIGLLVGYVAAAAFGFFEHAYFSLVRDAPWIGLPGFHFGLSFDPSLTAPFAIAAIAAAMKAGGTITICQRINDAHWVRPDLHSLTRGVFADGVTTVVAGLAGAVGTNTSTPGVSVAAASGVTSRIVALFVGLIFLLLGFCPKLTAMLAIMPRSIVVAALLFTVTFIIINGVQVMTSRLLDARRTLMLGFAIVAGGAVEIFPSVVNSMPAPLAPLVGSSLVFATLIALGLNLLFRIGIRQSAELKVERNDFDRATVESFFLRQGAVWGARPDVTNRATFALIQLIEAITDHVWHRGPLTVTASFDEFHLNVSVSYEGDLLEFPVQRPSIELIVASEDGARLLAGYVLRANADRIRTESKNGKSIIYFDFDH
jgi:xanthine permease XanP